METVHPSPLPTLSAEDQALLASYFEANEDLLLLAKKEGSKGLIGLLQWLSQPEIAAYLQAYRDHQSHLDRNLVIEALRSILKSTTDLIESRRAATTLLRALNPIRPSSSPSLGGGRLCCAAPEERPTRPPSNTHRHPPANRASPRNPEPSTPPPAAAPTSYSPTHPLTLSPPHPRPSLAEALAILGIPNLTDEQEDALEDAEIDAFDDEGFDTEENTS